MTLSFQTNDVIHSIRSNMSSRVLGNWVQLRTEFLIRKIWTTADTKYSWFFNMAANMAGLTTNFNGNFWHFLITKSSFCLGKTYSKITKIRYLLKFWSATFDP